MKEHIKSLISKALPGTQGKLNLISENKVKLG